MKEQLFPLGAAPPPPLGEPGKHRALLMNIRRKNNTVTCTGHYLQFVLAWCANCQGGDTSVSTGSRKIKKKKKDRNRQVGIWTQQLKLIFPTAYVNGDTIFTGNRAGPRRSATRCLYKAKTWGKSQESILNTFGRGQVLSWLRKKKKKWNKQVRRVLWERCFFSADGWQSPRRLPAPQLLTGAWMQSLLFVISRPNQGWRWVCGGGCLGY